MTAADLSSIASTGNFTSQASVAAEEADLQQFMQNLSKEIQGKFTTLLDSVMGRIDEMTGRIEEMEKHVNELIVSSSQAAQE